MRVVLLDGYTDEPAGLGVPPYLDVYARYVAGALWSIDKSIDVRYYTVDQARVDRRKFAEEAKRARLLIVVAGVTTPGKYLGGEPIKLHELRLVGGIEGPLKVLGGPVARFGYGDAGGSIAVPPSKLKEGFDLVVKGDLDLVVYELVRNGLSISSAPPDLSHEDFRLVDSFAVLGAKVVQQHPNYGKNLVVELETYRSCPRWVTGGCSFCTTVRRGPVVYRSVEGIVREVEALHNVGVRNFRLGRQADFYSYMSFDTGKAEFPKPNVEAIRRLLHGIRSAASPLEVLHIDNVNPGTVYHWREESLQITKLLVEYCTPGNVAAMGVETADPRVVKANNLKAMPEESYEAVKLVSSVGRAVGWNGMPYLLPGINFVAGLPGETKETYRLNIEFLKRLLEEDVLVRRVNIRQVLVLPGTPLWHSGLIRVREHRKYFVAFKEWVRKVFDRKMLERVVPKGTLLRRVFTEQHYGEGTYARQVGSYPVLVYLPARLELGRWIDVLVVGHGSRSVVGVPCPLNINTASRRLLEHVPGMAKRTVFEVLRRRPFKSLEEVERVVGRKLSEYFTI